MLIQSYLVIRDDARNALSEIRHLAFFEPDKVTPLSPDRRPFVQNVAGLIEWKISVSTRLKAELLKLKLQRKSDAPEERYESSNQWNN